MSGWLIALIAVGGVLLLLLLLLLFGMARLRVTCREDVWVSLRVLGLRFRLYPRDDGSVEPKRFCRNPNRALARELRRQKKAIRRAEKKRLKKQKKAAETANRPKPNLPENLSMILALLKDFYRVANGKLRLRTLRMQIVVATDNAAQTALIWGSVTASASLLLNWMNEHFLPIEHYRGEVDIRPDFAGGDAGADIDLVLSVRLWSALRIAMAMRGHYTEEKEKAQKKAIRRIRRKAERKAKKANQKSSQM